VVRLTVMLRGLLGVRRVPCHWLVMRIRIERRSVDRISRNRIIPVVQISHTMIRRIRGRDGRLLYSPPLWSTHRYVLSSKFVCHAVRTRRRKGRTFIRMTRIPTQRTRITSVTFWHEAIAIGALINRSIRSIAHIFAINVRMMLELTLLTPAMTFIGEIARLMLLSGRMGVLHCRCRVPTSRRSMLRRRTHLYYITFTQLRIWQRTLFYSSSQHASTLLGRMTTASLDRSSWLIDRAVLKAASLGLCGRDLCLSCSSCHTWRYRAITLLVHTLPTSII